MKVTTVPPSFWKKVGNRPDRSLAIGDQEIARQGFPENDFCLCLARGAFTTFAVGIFIIRSPAANIGKEHQADRNYQEKDEQPDVLISSHVLKDELQTGQRPVLLRTGVRMIRRSYIKNVTDGRKIRRQA